MTGGDSLTEDLNVYYNAGDIAWMITSTALVLLMIPGVGYGAVDIRILTRCLTVAQFLLLRSCSTQIGSFTHLAFSSRNGPDLVPVVLLGLLTHFLPLGWQIHR
jgi:hypothetical protein